MLALVAAFDPQWLADVLRYAIAALATVTLVVAAHGAMLGLSRLAYSLATQPPDPQRARRACIRATGRRTS